MEDACIRGCPEMIDKETTVKTMERLRSVRRQLVREYPFFGELLMNLQLAVAEVETACTDGKHLIVDPGFSERLTDEARRVLPLFQKKRKKAAPVEHCL